MQAGTAWQSDTAGVVEALMLVCVVGTPCANRLALYT